MLSIVCLQIANHPLLVRRIYNDGDVVRLAKKLYPKGVFGYECTLDRVIEEMKGYSDFSIHRVLICHYVVLSPILHHKKGRGGNLGQWCFCGHFLSAKCFLFGSSVYVRMLNSLLFAK